MTAPTRNTIRDLCHRWRIIEAKRNLDMLEQEDDSDAASDALMKAALQQHRAIETAILETPTADITDADLIAMLNLARHVINNQDFADEQDERCFEIIDHVRLTLCHREQDARMRARDAA